MDDFFIPVPETVLPCGMVVPAFEVGKFLCTPDQLTSGADITPDRPPMTMISFHAALEACFIRGWRMITETQWLAIAWDVCRQNEN